MQGAEHRWSLTLSRFLCMEVTTRVCKEDTNIV